MKVTFKPSGLIYEAREGMSIMDAIRFNDLKLDAPCGGNGTCKKCKVMVTDDKGTREVLACMTKITGGNHRRYLPQGRRARHPHGRHHTGSGPHPRR